VSDEDPEVRADIELRARTERQRGRTSNAATWSPPEIAARWPCRVCRTLVDVSGDGVALYLRFNEMLKRRNEEPLSTEQIMYCDACRGEFKRTAAERRRGQIERMRPLIQRLKRSGNPESERALILQLEQWGHPDVNGLVQAIRDRIASKGRKPERTEV
jgi:hypothetical protein